MLVLSRKKGDQILIGDEITITIVETKPCGVRVGIDAPKHVRILRRELLDADSVSHVFPTTSQINGNVLSSHE